MPITYSIYIVLKTLIRTSYTDMLYFIYGRIDYINNKKFWEELIAFFPFTQI